MNTNGDSHYKKRLRWSCKRNNDNYERMFGVLVIISKMKEI